MSARRKGDEPAPVHLTDKSTGRFKLGPIPAGTYVVNVNAPGYGVLTLGPHLVETGSDLGPGGGPHGSAGYARLAIESRRREASRQSLDRLPDEGPGSGRAGPSPARGSTFSGLLAPGRYELHVDSSDTVPATRSLVVVAGETTSLEIVLQAGSAVRFHFTEALGGVFSDRLHVRLFDRQTLITESDLERHRAYPIEWALGLRPGSYRIEATSPDGGTRAHAALTLSDPVDARNPIEIPLR